MTEQEQSAAASVQARDPSETAAEVLAGAGSALRGHRRRLGLSLTQVSRSTGISVSTLSRLETGERTPGLNHLVTLASVYGTGLDELVGARLSHDPRLRFDLVEKHGRTIMPLSQTPGGLSAAKTLIHPLPGGPPEPLPHTHGEEPGDRSWEYESEMMRRHRGYVWVLVLSGRLRLLLGSHDLVLRPGEAAEFDTRVAHWLGPADAAPVETLTVHGDEGQRIRVRARPRER